MTDTVWYPIDTAPKNNTAFDVQVEAPDGSIIVIPNCRYVRNFNVWEIRGTQNKLSSYFKPLKWRAIVPVADTQDDK